MTSRIAEVEMRANLPVPDHLLTVEEWDGIEESEASRRYELVEGVVVVSPRPRPRHQVLIYSCVHVLKDRLPVDFKVLPEVELAVDLRRPPTIRVPDVLVAEGVDLESPRVDRSAALLAVEILSPGSRRIDRVLKFAEYQEAGIPSYWIIDPEAVGDDRFVAFDLRDGRYVEAARGDGIVKVSSPSPMTFDVDALLSSD